MNTAMATLAKGAVSVVLVVGVVVGVVSGVFRFSPDARSEREGKGGPATSAPTAGAAGSSVAGGAASAPGGTAPVVAAAPGARPAPSVNLQPIAQGQASVEPTKPRSGTDFSADDAPWQKLLAGAGGDATAGQTLATSGRAANGVLACASCHGAAGVPDKSANFPALAGLSPEYLAKQLSDFRSGTRNNPVMSQVARALTDADIGALSVYYAGQAAPPVAPPATGAAAADRGRFLHEFGDNALALAACANCHGARGAGEGPLLPRLAGQPRQYLLDQLEAFRSGQRKNDDVGTMQAIAKRLNGADSEAVATFYSSLAAPR